LTIPRIYSPESLENKTNCELEADNLKYLKQVMRLKQGDRIRIFDGFGLEFEAVIKEFYAKSVLIELGQKFQQQRKKSASRWLRQFPKPARWILL